MKYFTALVTLAVIAIGCSHAADYPVTPKENMPVAGADGTVFGGERGPHMLWGRYMLYIDSDRTRVDVVPVRQARFHLNALKFLEKDCPNCLQITQMKTNWDGTVDMTVRITHPFKGLPQFTGFDVKGIIMFNGSYEHNNIGVNWPLPKPFYTSWRELGDPEVLNPDGYAFRWTPQWDSGSEQPILKY
ncbi:MAG TPA: hypothetical protein ENN67_08615, partial [Firmicutes bacterium]|nr:hypothetical protein [Bacillota bacterium]